MKNENDIAPKGGVLDISRTNLHQTMLLERSLHTYQTTGKLEEKTERKEGPGQKDKLRSLNRKEIQQR
ncbi:hypothetical protein ACROYT_G013409 [Oculina patagonica]